MSYERSVLCFIRRRFVLASVFVVACGGDPGGTAGGSSETGATGGATTGAPTTGATTGASTGSDESSGNSSNSGTQGQTDTGASSTGAVGTSTGEVGTGTGEVGTSTGADLCEGFVPQGCLENGCPRGQMCKILRDVCVSSDCACDPGTGEIVCSPDCGGGSCVPDCGQVPCNLFCEFGFKTDGNGCEVCECNEPPGCECAVDADCVKTSTGCCPCNSGGDEAPAHKDCVDQVMQCDIPPDQVVCLEVFLCTDVQPACVNGQCTLQ